MSTKNKNKKRKQGKDSLPKFTNAMGRELIKLIESPAVLTESIQDHIARIGQIDKIGTWGYYFAKLAKWIENGMEDKPPFSVFYMSGNSKLDFAAFSSLPFVDCPGKGECESWCYSVKAWRYPAAFCRQIQNSLLVRFRFNVIENHYKRIRKAKTLRLYVDGDFPSVAILRQWMDLVKTRQDLSVYGYSKSWSEFLRLDHTGFNWPKNYVLNLSSGSKFADQSGIHNAMKHLPITRGDFDAVLVDHQYIDNGAYRSKEHPDSIAYRKEVRIKLKKLSGKVFACPGSCRNCMAGGKHACGTMDMLGVTVGTGIHSKVA